jgi:DNA-binding CsgD family transcriptional regulator
MPQRSATSVLSALGLTRQQERLHRQVQPYAGRPLHDVAWALAIGDDDLREQLRPLCAIDLVALEDDVLVVRSPAEAMVRLLARQASAVADVGSRLDDLITAVPFVAAAGSRPGEDETEDEERVDGEVTSGGNPLALLSSLIANSRGDLAWLRPDAWQLPRESAMAKVIAGAVASGRRSRAIYPARALQEAPDVLLARAQAGEQVRVIGHLPTRMIVIGSTHAVLPEPLGYADEPRVLVRQPALVAALALWFEALWEQASPVRELDLGNARPDLRKFVLEQLAVGAKDEQIARNLGISLRTARRRVADVMTELGVDTRFQAGVEAVRRGWL